MSGNRTMALPTLWLAPLLAVILVGSLGAPWNSVATVDERTYLEMSLGIQETGLPTVENGPVDRFPALQARWNLYRDGQLWGAMAPGFPYLAAPLLRLGGIGAVIRLNLALLALLALAVYLLGKRLGGEAEVGVAAAYIALLSIPLWTSSFGLLPYSFAITGVSWALYLGVRALEGDSVRWAALTGLLAGLATTTQLLVFPMLLGLVAALAWHRRSLGVSAALGSLPAFALLAVVNRTRFGSWNPLSDGPCVWQGCPDSGVDPQSADHMIAAALPLLGWLSISALLLWSVRRQGRGPKVLTVLATIVPLLALPSLRADLQSYLGLAWHLLIDVGIWPDAENTTTAADGLGTFIGPHVVKALLQSSPALVLVAAAPFSRNRLSILWLPALSLFAMLILRAPMPVDFALGHPFLNLRYLAPAAPVLAVLAALGARRLRWRLSTLALAGLVAATLRWTLHLGADDLELWRRLLLLRGPLLVAAALALSTALALRRPSDLRVRTATLLAAIAFGWGAGVSLGVDLAATVRLRDRVEFLVRGLDGHLPHRFALIGHPNELDAPLSWKGTRDIEYLDLKEVTTGSQVDELVRWWQRDRRPVFWLLAPGEEHPTLAEDLVLEQIEPQLGLARVRAPGPAAGVATEASQPEPDPALQDPTS